MLRPAPATRSSTAHGAREPLLTPAAPAIACAGFTNRRKRYWRCPPNKKLEPTPRPLAEQAYAERGLSYPALARSAAAASLGHMDHQ